MASDQSVELPKTGRANQTPSKHRLRCGRVADLVNLAETRICGPNHIGTTAFAEGLARFGERSASRLGGARRALSTLQETVPCVYHSFSGGLFPDIRSASVVLVAGSHQEAVDHCLIAQHIAADLGIPVHCLVDASLQECLGCVELPPHPNFANHAAVASLREPVSPGSLIPCFESASTSLGRVYQPVMSFGPETARQVLIAGGREANLARTLLDQGCISGETRLVHVQLLRPFPKEELLRDLQGSEHILFLTRQDDPLNAELLAALEILAAGNRDLPTLALSPLSRLPLTPLNLLSALPDGFVNKTGPGIHTPPPSGLQLQIGSTPAGRWSRELLVESASALIRTISPTIQRDSLHIRQDEPANPTFSRLDIGATDEDPELLDLLFYTENNLVDARPALEQLKQNGILIFHCESPNMAAVWLSLSAESRDLLQNKNIETWSICPRHLFHPDGDIADQSFQVLNGALLKTLSAKLDLDNTLDSAPLSTLEKAGVQAVGQFNLVDHIDGRSVAGDDAKDVASTESTRTPGNEEEWRQALRAFHLTGSGGYSESEPLPGLPLWPALATKLLDDHRLATYYPGILPSPTNMAEDTQYVSLLELLQGPESGADGESLANREQLEQAVCKIETVTGTTPSPEIPEIVAAAFRDIVCEQGDKGSDAVSQDLLSRLPDSGRLVGYGPDTLALFYSWAVAARRHDNEKRFHAEVDELIAGLQDLLQVELSHRETGRAPRSLAAAMGQQAATFVDLDKLSQNLPEVGGSEILSDMLLELVRETLEVLQAYQSSEFRSLPFYLISSGEGPKFPELPATAQFASSDCFEAALGFVDGLLARMSRVFRAIRVSRLVISGRYQPEMHDEVFARFEWQSCNDEEILLVPRVLVVESSTGIKNKETEESLNRLLRSGRPVQILITLDESELTTDELSGALEDLGTIAMANREACVLQSTLARPDHLVSGLREMVGTVRPAIAFVSSHAASQPGNWGWASELLSHQGRLATCFRYSPDQGISWSDRMDLSGNPQVEAGQPVYNLASASLPSASDGIVESVTFAHAAALRPDFRDHFRVIPRDAWSDDQQPIGDYLNEFKSLPPASLPYIWIVRNGELCRAIVTRGMANACRDRTRAWSSLQELAMIDSEFASKAREQVQQELETRYENETELARAKGRQEGTVLAVNRIVEALLGTGTPDTSANLLPETVEGEPPHVEDAAPTQAKPPETSPKPKKPEPAKEQRAAPASKPYIDSELCTSCNDCIKINPVLFVYDANNQAEIGDPLAGSFVELVKAAEKCPARCIHPGEPRADDKTATPAIIKRASKFQ